MGVRVMESKDENVAVIYCSVTEWAFGPRIYGDENESAYEIAERFIAWLPKDARLYKDAELESKYYDFLRDLEQLRKDEETKQEEE